MKLYLLFILLLSLSFSTVYSFEDVKRELRERIFLSCSRSFSLSPWYYSDVRLR